MTNTALASLPGPQRAAEALATQAFDLLAGDPDIDLADFRQKAINALFSSRKVATRSRQIRAARSLAHYVLEYCDGRRDGFDIPTDNISAASQQYESLRIG